MKRSLLRSAVVWLSRIKYRKGYGVQSPFAYSFFRDILFEDLPYYDFDKLKVIKDPKLSEHTLQIMYRIVNMVSPDVIFDINPLSAAPACYLSGVLTKSRTISFTEDKFVAKDISENTKSLGLHSEVRCGNILKEIMEVCSSTSEIGFVNIGLIDNDSLLFEVSKLLYSRISDDGVLMIEGIDRSKVKGIWEMLSSGQRSCVAFDLYDIGIIFFKARTDNEYYKVNY